MSFFCFYLPQFMALFFPDIHAEIDWSRGYESLDTELQKIAPDAEEGKRLADKLIKVWRRDGQAQLVLIHIEVQGDREMDFSERMLVYHYRILDRYRQPTVSLAVLSDEYPTWRPDHYRSALWGCELSFRFPVVKLTDYQARWAQLDRSDNPFATIVMAHLKTKATRRDPQARLVWKLSLVKRLYEKGYERHDIVELFRFIDWLLRLPDELERRFSDQLHEYEATMSTPYITSIERRGIEKGLQQGLEKGLQQGEARGLQRGLSAQRTMVHRQAQRRFGRAVAQSLSSLLEHIDDPEQMAEVSEWLLDATDGETLLQNVQALIQD